MSTGYVIRFTLIMTTLVALILSTLFYTVEPIAKKNEAVFKKRAILAAIKDYLPKPIEDMSDDEVLQVFEKDMKQLVINSKGEIIEGEKADEIDLAQERKLPVEERKFPFFEYSSNGEKYYILSLRGKGLWDEIWGNVALKGDLNTIAGASFDHVGETPGLGAEIKDNPKFTANFIGKTIHDKNGKYMPVFVAKGTAKPGTNSVDGISGATITGKGVSTMLQTWLKFYEPYLNKIKSSNKIGMNTNH